MKTIFEEVQAQFMYLSTLLSGLDLKDDLIKPEVLTQLNDALCDAYILMNQGFCEKNKMYEKCLDNRNQLRALCEMIDIAEEHKEVSHEMYMALNEFIQNIPQILSKMEMICIDNFQNAKV